MGRLIPLLLALSIPLILAKDFRSDLQAASVAAVFPGDAGYPSACETFNLRFTFKPVAVSFPATPEQVSSAIKLGSSYGHHVAARSGGHSYIANGLGGSDGVLVVDMRNFTKISVDANAGTAVIEIGNRLGNVALALNNAGRALPHGTCPYVGLGGHSGYGGFGYTSRMWGMTLDTIQLIHMVLPNGTITTASSTSNSDLFWAMRGSAGSFGITTAIEVTTFEAPPSATFYRYIWNMNVQDATNAMAKFQTFVETNIPPQLGGELIAAKGSVRGNITFGLSGGCVANLGGVLDTTALDTTTAPDKNDTFYAKSLMTPEKSPMSNSALHTFASYMANQGFDSNTTWFVEIELLELAGHCSAWQNQTTYTGGSLRYARHKRVIRAQSTGVDTAVDNNLALAKNGARAWARLRLGPRLTIRLEAPHGVARRQPPAPLLPYEYLANVPCTPIGMVATCCEVRGGMRVGGDGHQDVMNQKMWSGRWSEGEHEQGEDASNGYRKPFEARDGPEKAKLVWNDRVLHFITNSEYGGKNSAINTVAPDATAFAHRSSMFTIQFYASSESGLPPYPASGLSFMDGMVNSITSNSPPNWDYGAYPNYIDSRLNDWQRRYYGQHYERLRSLKKLYDPQDLFDFPTAIED
ncbi:hypothetical protein BD779DRAFT_1789126 [Infundibulicybe gibba]|nr:hypothetical protein BD779DRAFT_1789126 [Infundibulicybe gibba]